MRARRTIALGATALLTIAGVCLLLQPRSRQPEADPTRSRILPETDVPPLAGLPDPEEFDLPLRTALEEAVAAVNNAPEDPQAWGDLGMLCHAHGLYAETRHAYRRAQDLQSGDALWPHLLGLVCELLSRPDEAAKAFSRSIAMEPYDIVSRCSLARIHAARGQDEEARRLYLAALKIDPKSVAARVGLGQLAARRGVLDMAETNLELALEGFPRCGPAHAALAQIYERQGRSTAAAFHRGWSLACGDRIPLSDPYLDRIEGLGVSYAACLKRGRRAGERGDWAAALKDFRAAVKMRGDLAEPLYFLGVGLIHVGDVSAGLETLERVTQLEGRKVDAWLHIARVHAGGGEMERAHRAVDEALGVDPKNVHAFTLRGDLLRREENITRALAAYDRAIVLDSSFARAYLATGELLHLRGAGCEEAATSTEVRETERERAAAALAAFERAVELQADLGEAYGGAGRAHMQLWEFSRDESEKVAHLEGAIERFGQRVKYFPEQKSGHVALIRALHTAGRRKESLTAIHRARERWPGDPLFRKRGVEGSRGRGEEIGREGSTRIPARESTFSEMSGAFSRRYKRRQFSGRTVRPIVQQ